LVKTEQDSLVRDPGQRSGGTAVVVLETLDIVLTEAAVL
jgi:hypothetical protein